MPLTKLQSRPTTNLSCYDRMERNQTKNITEEELNAERKAEGFQQRNGLEFNKGFHHRKGLPSLDLRNYRIEEECYEKQYKCEREPRCHLQT
jgi:hypothetical protein